MKHQGADAPARLIAPVYETAPLRGVRDASSVPPAARRRWRRGRSAPRRCASRRTSSAMRARPSRVNDSTLERRRKSLADRPLATSGPRRRSAGRATAPPRSRRRPPASTGRGRSRRRCRSRSHSSSASSVDDLQMFRSDLVDDVHGLVRVARQHQGAELLQALARQVGARQAGQLRLQGGRDGVQQRGVPRHQDAGAGRVFGLGEQVGGDEGRRGGFVGQHDDLARARRCSRWRPGRRRAAWPGPRTGCPARRSCPRPAAPRRRKPGPPPPGRRRRGRPRVTPSSWQTASRSRL